MKKFMTGIKTHVKWMVIAAVIIIAAASAGSTYAAIFEAPTAESMKRSDSDFSDCFINWSAPRTKYPTGFIWTGTYEKHVRPDHGWVCTVGEMISGKDPYTWSRKYSFDDLKKGDIISFDEHSIMVTDVNDTFIIYADCNGMGNNKVCWDQTVDLEKLGKRYGDLNYVMSCPKS